MKSMQESDSSSSWQCKHREKFTLCPMNMHSIMQPCFQEGKLTCAVSRIADRRASLLGVMYIVGAAPSVHSRASHCGSSENRTAAAREARGLLSATS